MLDFGCGTGSLAPKVARYVGELVAIDTLEKLIDIMTDKHSQGLLHTLPASKDAAR
ncbi:class I SAM-dependent methyltransferase [Yoonia sp.]|uniref:class I SAM-dependent methyltransferase n=1 Tax=Yoonia sp. TaxID=2212373 RepID=UPI003F6ACB1B